MFLIMMRKGHVSGTQTLATVFDLTRADGGERQHVSESDRLELESVPCELSVSDTSSQPLILTLFLT